MARPAVVGRFPGAGDVGLTLVSAPAGAGKTAAAAEWAARASRPVGWLSVDRSDNDPNRFWGYFAAVLASALPTLTPTLVLEMGAQGTLTPDQRFAGLVNHLATNGDMVAVCLDDYDVISDESVHAGLTFLLDHAISQLQLVVLCRRDPPLPLARLRTRGLLTEIRSDLLSFSRDEAEQLLHTYVSRGLSADDIDSLHAQTEGWAAGLYLAALSLREHGDRAGFVKEFAGDDRDVVDYFASEVLARLTTVERSFLTRTSILERFCAPLCRAVTDIGDAAGVLLRLERANCFVVALDSRRYWHRYHHLFADLLHQELLQREPDLILELHRRASAWLATEGHGPEAIGHAILAEDWDSACSLVATHWEHHRDNGLVKTVDDWVGALPPDRVNSDPRLALANAWIALTDGRLDDADRWHAAAERALTTSAAEVVAAVRTSLLTSRATVGGLRGDVVQASAIARQAVEHEHVNEGSEEGRALAIYGSLLFLCGDRSGASDALGRALKLCEQDGHYGAVLLAQGYLVDLEPNTADGARRARAALEQAADHGYRNHYLNSRLRIAVGRQLREQGELEAAEVEVRQALTLARRGQTPLYTAYCLLEWAELLHAQGNSPKPAVLEARRLAAQCPDPGVLSELITRASARFRLPTPGVAADEVGMVEELTGRELNVLALLPSDLTQEKIAEELYISWNTVKTHVQAIYRKLGVTSRKAAVARARGLGLLVQESPHDGTT